MTKYKLKIYIGIKYGSRQIGITNVSYHLSSLSQR